MQLGTPTNTNNISLFTEKMWDLPVEKIDLAETYINQQATINIYQPTSNNQQ